MSLRRGKRLVSYSGVSANNHSLGMYINMYARIYCENYYFKRPNVRYSPVLSNLVSIEHLKLWLRGSVHFLPPFDTLFLQ